MAFKMKGNPMKRNFGIGDKPMTKINRGDDKGNPTAAFQKHDGKTFDDPGFMDSHFPSGAPRPMKMKHKSATKLMKDKSAMKLKMDPKMARTGLKDIRKKSRTMTSEMKMKPTKKVAIHKSKLRNAMNEGPTEGLMERAKSPAKIAKVGKKAISMAEKPVKAISKRKAKRAAKKAGKGNVVTTVQSATKMKKKSAMKKTTYMLKKGGKKVKVSKAEYEKAVGGKAGSKLSAMKMKKKSAMKKVGTMSDAEKAKAEQERIKKAYLQYQKAETDKIKRGESVKKVMTFEEFKKKMG